MKFTKARIRFTYSDYLFIYFLKKRVIVYSVIITPAAFLLTLKQYY